MYSRRLAIRRGRQDGRTWRWALAWPPWVRKDPYPSPEARRPAELEQEVNAVAERDLHQLAAEWQESDKKLRSALVDAEHRLRELKHTVAAERVQKETALSEYREALDRFNGAERPSLPWWLHWPPVLLVVVGEAFLNTQVFSIFLENFWPTLLMAASLVVAIPLSAEILGRSLRHENKSAMDKAFLIIAPVVAVVVLAAVSVWRLVFFNESGGTSIVGHVSPDVFILSFLAINLLFYLVTVLAAYHGEPRRPFALAHLRRQLVAAKRQLHAVLTELKQDEAALTAAQKRYTEASVFRERQFKIVQERAEQVRKSATNLVWQYRAENRRGRRTVPEPEYFAQDPSELIKIPTSLHEFERIGEDPTADAAPPEPVAADAPKKEDVALDRIPLLFTEADAGAAAQTMFDNFLRRLDLQKQDLPTNLQLVFPVPTGLRETTIKTTWRVAWRDAGQRWNEADQRVRRTFAGTDWSYHVQPHVVLPLSFALGATVGLRRSITLYHMQEERYFPALDLTRPRALYEQPAAGTRETPSVVRPEGQGESARKLANKLILYVVISDRHKVAFNQHPDWKKADSVALVYDHVLPEGDWLPYVQHIVHAASEHVQPYRQVELCLICPSAVAFALGMSFARNPKVSVCHWFGSKERYLPVLSLRHFERHVAKMFS